MTLTQYNSSQGYILLSIKNMGQGVTQRGDFAELDLMLRKGMLGT